MAAEELDMTPVHDEVITHIMDINSEAKLYLFLKKNIEQIRPIINDLHSFRGKCKQHNQTLLSFICAFSSAEAAALLIENGANINGTGCSCPLTEALATGNSQCVQILLEAKVDLSAHCTYYLPEIAQQPDQRIKYLECAKLLKSAGVVVANLSLVSDNSTFAEACLAGNLTHATALIELNCDYDLTEIMKSPIIGQVLYEIDCYEAKKDQRMLKIRSADSGHF